MAIIRGHCWLTRRAMGKRAAAFPGGVAPRPASSVTAAGGEGLPARRAASPLVAAATFVIPAASPVIGLADRDARHHPSSFPRRRKSILKHAPGKLDPRVRGDDVVAMAIAVGSAAVGPRTAPRAG